VVRKGDFIGVVAQRDTCPSNQPPRRPRRRQRYRSPLGQHAVTSDPPGGQPGMT
jgi:hypothetical protein